MGSSSATLAVASPWRYPERSFLNCSRMIVVIELMAEPDGFREPVFPGTFGHALEPVFMVMDQQQICHEGPPVT